MPAATLHVPPTLVPGIVQGPPRRYELPRGTITLGRDPSNTITLPHPQVSRFHASIDWNGTSWAITDLHSSNGTFLNDRQVLETHALTEGDLVRISDFVFVYEPGVLGLFSEQGNARLDAIDLVRTVPPGVDILRHISLSILPREFVAVVGTSGAGKSTLAGALSGFRPADQGVVLLNGVDFYQNLDTLRESLGYVPQEDIIHDRLTVERALFYAACLRMPEDTSRREMLERIEEVLADLQLTERRHVTISRLSGGQRKRVSIGVELLTKPRLFFLDEPTSGLDPGLDLEMMKIFRRLADQGHTLILITHATTNINMCDNVVFLARGGTLVYYGPPEGALHHFGATDFPDVYAQVEARRPEEWERIYRESESYDRLVRQRLAEIPLGIVPGPAATALRERVLEQAPVGASGSTDHGGARASTPHTPTAASPPTRGASVLSGLLPRGNRRRTSWLRQFFVLTLRYGETVLRDPRNVLLLVLQAPIISLLLSMVFEAGIFDVQSGNYIHAKTLVFLMVCCSVWFGTSNSAREITKETVIYRRERGANLQIAPYVLSKLAVLLVLCLVQSAIMVAILWSRIDFPDLGPVMLQKMFLVLVLSSVGGLCQGLLLSAIVNNPDKAGSLVPIVLIPQLVLAGALIPLQGLAQEFAYTMLSRWGYDMLGQATRLAELPHPPLPGVEVDPVYGFDISFAGHFWVMLGFILAFLALTCLALKLKDRSGGAG